ncbi:carbon-nitrogen hydrolase family protein [Rhizobiales bacterium]|uniref:carbon-nitrogen hydrolase family protein n=1 Tax=Agrobacterium radiobacter TaxID=362 RepID=UPI0013A6E9A9
MLVEDPETFKSAVFAVWLCMSQAGDGVCSTYRSFSEASLATGVSTQSLDKVFDPFDEADTSDGFRMRVFEELAIRLRFLEELFYSTDDANVSRRSNYYRVTFDGESAFFINRAPRNRSAKGGEPFIRRAFARSRMIPGKIGQFQVTLEAPQDAAGRARSDAGAQFQLGAAVFDRLVFNIDYDDRKHFIVKSTSSPDQLKTIVDDIERASALDCTGVVYPELTISGEIIRELRRALASDEIKSTGLSFILAGSSHEQTENGLYVNQSLMLDLVGTPIARHKKLFRYTEKNGSQERIELGKTLTVVLLADRVISTAICLDFCNIFDNPPFDHLDVDLLLVPSCGSTNTMTQHVNKAAHLHDQVKLKTVVVQQHYDEAKPPEPADLIGYILSPSNTGHHMETAHRTEPWRLLTL